ncbi:hypothetical protein GQ53DRAFT_766258 [Thozetella sp. PMI_491]|nr:hypothetical protein GQ53DRAFT_766258 [Thozetella sp. PMI_491]
MTKRKGLAGSIKDRISIKRARRGSDLAVKSSCTDNTKMASEQLSRQDQIVDQRNHYFTSQDALWSEKDDHDLDVAISRYGVKDWHAIAATVSQKTADECVERYNRLYWTPDEDDRLCDLIDNWENEAWLDYEARSKWSFISLHIAYKDPLQCRDRWRHINWTEDEDMVLRQAVATCGRNQWWQVAFWLPYKTGRQCKLQWMDLNGTTSSGTA